ncbi:MAG: galactokinase [Thermosipho sp. (in: Bacteria)]|nr:galactokinase [Thermosipho sp. (in: thermotogales)]
MKVKAPGRVNIIGEHTDYNDGYVLPFAINRYVEVEIEDSEFYRFYSETLNECIELRELHKTGTWVDYIIGVIFSFENRGYKIPPISVKINSNLPIGGGLSSSAALEVATAFAISKKFGFDIPNFEMVNVAREAEMNFVGVKCGIMDQFVSIYSRKDFAIFLDTKTLDFKYIPLRLMGYEMYIINSKVKHELSFSEYNVRKEECEKILAVLGKRSFRELKRSDLNLLSGFLKKRAQHVIEENERVLSAVEQLIKGNFKKLGELLYESHESLRYLYEVSCDETDFIVEYLKAKEGILGARMIGGGFGGSVLVLAEVDRFGTIINSLIENYYEKFGIELEYYKIESSDGVSIL